MFPGFGLGLGKLRYFTGVRELAFGFRERISEKIIRKMGLVHSYLNIRARGNFLMF